MRREVEQGLRDLEAAAKSLAVGNPECSISVPPKVLGRFLRDRRLLLAVVEWALGQKGLPSDVRHTLNETADLAVSDEDFE